MDPPTAVPCSLQGPLPPTEIRKVAVGDIDPSTAVQKFRRPDGVYRRSLAQSILTYGLHNPVKVCFDPTRPGKYLLINGWLRLDIHKTELKRPVIDALVFLGILTPQQIAQQRLTDNTAARETPVWTKVLAVHELVCEGYSVQQACDHYLLEYTLNSKLKAYAESPEEVKALILAQEPPVSVVQEVLKAPSEKMIEVLQQALEKKLTAKETKALVATFKKPRQKSLKIPGIGEVKLAPGQDLKSLLKALQEGKK